MAKHEFIVDQSVDISELDGIVKVEVCKYCDVRLWTWTKTLPDKSKKNYQYMFVGNTQYWNPDEECKDTYGLRRLKEKRNETQTKISF